MQQQLRLRLSRYKVRLFWENCADLFTMGEAIDDESQKRKHRTLNDQNNIGGGVSERDKKGQRAAVSERDKNEKRE